MNDPILPGYRMVMTFAPGIKAGSKFGQLFLEGIAKAQRDMNESVACDLYHKTGFSYRPYRRGQNRCRFCGCRKESQG